MVPSVHISYRRRKFCSSACTKERNLMLRHGNKGGHTSEGKYCTPVWQALPSADDFRGSCYHHAPRSYCTIAAIRLLLHLLTTTLRKVNHFNRYIILFKNAFPLGVCLPSVYTDSALSSRLNGMKERVKRIRRGERNRRKKNPTSSALLPQAKSMCTICTAVHT
jgi:hypothetical protein